MTDEPRKRLRSIAKRYKAEGYAVIISPADEQLPDSLSGLGIELIATKGNDNVVVEIASNLRLANESHKIQRILQGIADTPNWRVDFAVTPSRHGERGGQPLEPYSSETLYSRLGEARVLEKTGDAISAFLLAWTTIEATLTVLGNHSDVTPENIKRLRSSGKPKVITTSDMAGVLLKTGVIDRKQYGELSQGINMRNALAHGLAVSGPIPTVEWIERILGSLSQASPSRAQISVLERGNKLLSALCRLMQTGNPSDVSDLLRSLAVAELDSPELGAALSFFDSVFRRAKGDKTSVERLQSCARLGEPWPSRALQELALYTYAVKDYSRTIELAVNLETESNSDSDSRFSAIMLHCLCLLARKDLQNAHQLIGKIGPLPTIGVDTRARTAAQYAIVMFAFGEQALAEQAIDFLLQSYRPSGPSLVYPMLEKEVALDRVFLSLLKKPKLQIARGEDKRGNDIRLAMTGIIYEYRGIALCAARSATILRSCDSAKKAIVNMTRDWSNPLTIEDLENRLASFEDLCYNPPNRSPA